MALLPGGVPSAEGIGSQKQKGVIRSWKNLTWHSKQNKLLECGNISTGQGLGTPTVRVFNRVIYGLLGIASLASCGTPFISDSGGTSWLLVGYADRFYPWRQYCGIPGGIPNRTIVYGSFNPASGQSAIQNAIAACPPDRVVELAAGTYSYGLTITAANQCTLRGAGPGQTTFTGAITVTGGTIGASADGWSNPRPISSGYTKGSRSIILASTPPSSFVVGSNICIVQDDDYDLVWHREGNWAGTHNLRFVSRITSVTTTFNTNDTIGLATPIPYSYSAGFNPICTATVNNVHLFGIEEITVNGPGITLQGADRCWLKDVEVRNYTNQGAVMLQYGSAQCEVRRCYFHDSSPWPPDDDKFCIMLQYNNSCHLIEDNIAVRTAQILVNGSSANYFGYNYIYDTQDGSTWVIAGLGSNHGPHPIMNLWEGNTAQRYQNDAYHGSGSHNTIFRNHIHGTNPSGFTSERQLIDLTRASYYETVVGNVLGDPSWNPYAYSAYLTAAHNLGYVYVLGWGSPDSADGTSDQGVTWTNWTAALPDARVGERILRHGNYDYFNDAQVWDPGITSHAIPDSLFYDVKPAWFGALAWPPIDPSGPTVGLTPASHRWANYVASGYTDLSLMFADEAITACDLYVDWHTGSDGALITDAIAAGSCRPTSPADVPDAYPGTTLTMMRIEADSASPVHGFVRCGGVNYDIGDTTQGAIYDHSTVDEQYITAHITPEPNIMSMGFMFRTSIDAEWAWWAHCGMYGFGNWAVIAPRCISGIIRLYLHTANSPTYSTDYIPLTRNTWYWITIQYNRTAGYAYLAAYNPTTWAQVGSTIPWPLGGSPPAVHYWSYGCLENQGNTDVANTWFGPAIFDWTDGTFPLLPTPA